MNSFLYLSNRFAFERLCCPGDLRFAFELLCSTVDLPFGFEQLCFSVDPLSVSWYEGPVLRDNLGASRDQQTGLWWTRIPGSSSPWGRSGIHQVLCHFGRGEHCALPAGSQVCTGEK